MACDKYGGWEIFENTGIKGPYEEKAAKKATFTCKHCQLFAKFDTSMKEINRLNEKVKNLEQELGSNKRTFAEAVKNIPEEFKSTKEEIVAVCNSNQNFRDDIAQSLHEVKSGMLNADSSIVLTAPQLKQAADEVEEIAKRKNSLIISGLPEGSTDAQDLINFVQLYHKDVSVPSLDDFADVNRVGKPLSDNRPRLLRVKLQSGAVRSRLLNLHTKRDQTLQTPKIFIRPDLTKAQSANDKKLREEWTSAGRDKFKISKGKIVPRAVAQLNDQSVSSNQIKDSNDQFFPALQQNHQSQDHEASSTSLAKEPPMSPHDHRSSLLPQLSLQAQDSSLSTSSSATLDKQTPMFANEHISHSPQRTHQSQGEAPSSTSDKSPQISSTSASAVLSLNSTQQAISNSQAEAPLSVTTNTNINIKDSVSKVTLAANQAGTQKNAQSANDRSKQTNNVQRI